MNNYPAYAQASFTKDGICQFHIRADAPSGSCEYSCEIVEKRRVVVSFSWPRDLHELEPDNFFTENNDDIPTMAHNLSLARVAKYNELQIPFNEVPVFQLTFYAPFDLDSESLTVDALGSEKTGHAEGIACRITGTESLVPKSIENLSQQSKQSKQSKFSYKC